MTIITEADVEQAAFVWQVAHWPGCARDLRDRHSR